MLDACIIGNGETGKAVAKTFGIKKYFDLLGANITLEEAAHCKYIFLCIPEKEIAEIVRQLSQYGNGLIVVRRGTVPGTIKHLAEEYNVPIVANPILGDMGHPNAIVIGADIPSWISAVWGIYEARFKGINIYKTDSVTAEMVPFMIDKLRQYRERAEWKVENDCKILGGNFTQVMEIIKKWKK